MSWDWCNECDSFHETRLHHPEWEVWHPDCGEERGDADLVRALDAEDAVERWAERDDARGDYSIIRGTTATVSVAARGSSVIAKYTVAGEAVPSYSATWISNEGADPASEGDRDG